MIATVYSWVAPVFFKVIAITIETKAFLMQSRNEMEKNQVRSQHFMLRAIASKMVSFFWCQAIFHACEGTIGRNGPEIAEKLVELKEVNLVLWLSVGLWSGWLAMSSKKAWCEDVKSSVCVYVHSKYVSMYVISIYSCHCSVIVHLMNDPQPCPQCIRKRK